MPMTTTIYSGLLKRTSYRQSFSKHLQGGFNISMSLSTSSSVERSLLEKTHELQRIKSATISESASATGPEQKSTSAQSKSKSTTNAHTRRHDNHKRGGGTRKGNRDRHKGQGQGQQLGCTATKTTRNSSTANKQKRKLKVFHNFNHLVKDSQAVRYKVHRPNCSCPKVRSLADTRDFLQARTSGFVVLPDVKKIQSIFTCGCTTAESFDRDPLGCEGGLLETIFSSTKDFITNVKISSASCILENEANGFLCITSSSRSLVDDAKSRAMDAKNSKMKRGMTLHPDHADHICILRQSSLKRSHIRIKSKDDTGISSEDSLLLQELQDQGVDLIGDDADAPNTMPKIEIGHHLKTMMNLTSMKGKDNFIFTMITTNKSSNKNVIKIDCPGGKRHLGETSFECAVRETEEETSLMIDETWLIGDDGIRNPVSSRDHKERGNVFFLARPPPTQQESAQNMFEDIVKDVFWTNTGLGTER